MSISELEYIPISWRNVIGWLFVFFCVCSIFLNGVVLVNLYKRIVLNANSDIITAALVLIDFLNGGLVAPLNAAQILNDHIIQVQNIDVIRRYLTSTLYIATANTITFLSIDTYLDTVKRLNNRIPKVTVYAIIIVCFISPSVSSTLLLFKDIEGIYALGVAIQFFSVLGITLYFYSALVIALNSKRTCRWTTMDYVFVQNKLRGAGTVVIILTLFIILNVPFAIHHLQIVIGQDFGRVFVAKSYTIVYLLCVSRSLINPLIYIYRAIKPRDEMIMIL